MTDEEYNNLLERVKKLESFHNVKDYPCLWDSMPETSPGSGMKIGLLSCPCSKCTPRC